MEILDSLKKYVLMILNNNFDKGGICEWSFYKQTFQILEFDSDGGI